MTVGIRVTLDGATVEMFEKVNALIDPDSNPPEGLLFHASWPTDRGYGATDFWRSRADYDRFAQERIAPAIASLGVTVAREIEEFEVHAHFPR